MPTYPKSPGEPFDYGAKKPDGQYTNYPVLSDEERAQGFKAPVRRTYIHDTCGAATTMGQAIAETYARDPTYYGSTFCSRCGDHFPVGEAGQFRWEDGTRVGTLPPEPTVAWTVNGEEIQPANADEIYVGPTCLVAEEPGGKLCGAPAPTHRATISHTHLQGTFELPLCQAHHDQVMAVEPMNVSIGYGSEEE